MNRCSSLYFEWQNVWGYTNFVREVCNISEIHEGPENPAHAVDSAEDWAFPAFAAGTTGWDLKAVDGTGKYLATEFDLQETLTGHEIPVNVGISMS